MPNFNLAEFANIISIILSVVATILSVFNFLHIRKEQKRNAVSCVLYLVTLEKSIHVYHSSYERQPPLNSFLKLSIYNCSNHVLNLRSQLVKVNILFCNWFNIGHFLLAFYDKNAIDDISSTDHELLYQSLLHAKYVIQPKTDFFLTEFSEKLPLNLSDRPQKPQTYLCKSLILYMNLLITFKTSITDSIGLKYKVDIDKCVAKIFRNEIVSSNKKHVKVPPKI